MSQGSQVGQFYEAVNEGLVDDTSVRTLVVAPTVDHARVKDIIWARLFGEGRNAASAAEERYRLSCVNEVEDKIYDQTLEMLEEMAAALLADINYLAASLPSLESLCVSSTSAVAHAKVPWACRRIVIGAKETSMDYGMDIGLDDDGLPLRDVLDRSPRVRELVLDGFLAGNFGLGTQTCRRIETLSLGSGGYGESVRPLLCSIFADQAVRLTSLALLTGDRVDAEAFTGTVGSLLRNTPVLQALTIELAARVATHAAVTATLQRVPPTLHRLVIRYYGLYERSASATDSGDPAAGAKVDPLRELAAGIGAVEAPVKLRELALRLNTGPADAELTRGEAWTALDAVCVQRGITLFREL